MKAQLDKLKKDRDHREGAYYAAQVQLLDPSFVALQASFSNFLMSWLVRAVDPKGQHPKQQIELPLPESAPDAFNMLPEFLFEDVIGFYSFVSRLVCSSR